MKKNWANIDLQWFGDNIEPPELSLGPELIPSDFEIVLGDAPEDKKEAEEYKGLSREALIAKIETTQTEAQKQKDSAAETLESDLKSLKQELQKKPESVTPQPPVQQQSENDEAFSHRLDENLYESGITKTMDQFYARRIQPDVQRILQSNLSISKKLLQLDPERKATAIEYAPEIDQEINMTPPQVLLYDVDAYQKAHDRVAARHVEDIVEKKVASALASQKVELEKTKVPEPPFSEYGTTPPPPATKTTKVYLPKKYEEEALRKGIPPKEYYLYLKRQGVLK